MIHQKFYRSWAFEALKGLAALLISLIIFHNPSRALLTLAIYIGLLAMGVGIFISARSAYHKVGAWKLRLAHGIIHLLIGLMIIVFPKLTVSLLLIFTGLWILFFGLLQFTTYLHWSDALSVKPVLLISALLSFTVGVLMIFNPFNSAVIASLILAVYGVLFSIARFYIAWLLFHARL